MKRILIFIMHICVVATFGALLMTSCQDKFHHNDSKDILIPVAHTVHKWGYIDTEGNIKIPLVYRTASNFREGRAKVKNQNGKVGYINQEGKYIISPDYADGTDFSEGKAFVVKEGEYPICINRSGKILFKLDGVEAVEAFHNSTAMISSIHGKVGFIDDKGKIIAPMIYSEADGFSQSPYAIVRLNNKWGAINKEGMTIIRPTFQQMKVFTQIEKTSKQKETYKDPSDSMYLAPAKLKNKWGYVDITGKFVIEPIFTDAESFKNGLATIKFNNKVGYINPDGVCKIIVDADEGFPFSEGYARIKKDNKYGFIDKKGNIVISPTYDHAEDVHYQRAIVQKDMGTGWIDVNKNEIISPSYITAIDIDQNHILIESAGQYGIVNSEGMVTVIPNYKFATAIPAPWAINKSNANSKYYNATDLINKLFRHTDNSDFGEYSAQSSIDDILKQMTYDRIKFKIAEQNKNEIEYNLKNVPIEINPDIHIASIILSFNNNLHEPLYDYLIKEKEAKTIKLRAMKYLFGLHFNACGKSRTIAMQIANKIMQTYNQELKMSANNRVYYTSKSKNMYFLIVAGNTRLGLQVYFDKKDLTEAIKTYNKIKINYMTRNILSYDDNPAEEFISQEWRDDTMRAILF